MKEESFSPSTSSRLTDLSSFQSTADALVGNTSRTLEVFTSDLEPQIYARQDFVDAVSGFLTRHQKAAARILVRNPERAFRDGHPLVELSRRLSSRMQVRKTAAEHTNHAETFMIVDSQGFLWRPDADRYEGNAGTNDRGRARNLLDFFNLAWEHGIRELEFSRLHL